WAARLHRHVLHLDDLLRVRLRQRAAEHGEVLGEQIDGAAVDRAPAGDDAVAGDFLLQHVELLERALVEQELDALAGGQLAALVLGLDAPFATAQPGLRPPRLKPVEDVLHRRLKTPARTPESSKRHTIALRPWHP